MSDGRTSRLQLHAIDVAEGERIVARSTGPGDAWTDDFPFEGDVGAVGNFLRASAARGEQRPFGHYLITRLADGRAVGGIGFNTWRAAASSVGSSAVILLITTSSSHEYSRSAHPLPWCQATVGISLFP